MQLSPSFVAGVRACLPVLPGVATFGAISGVAMVGAGLPGWVAMAMSIIVFAGTAQLAALQLIAGGAPLPVIWLASLILNLRFVLYSLAVSPVLRGASIRVRAVLSYMLSDNGYAHFISRYTAHPAGPGKADYLLGSNTAVWVIWQIGTLAGVVVGSRIPTGWMLEFTVALTFLALGVSMIKDRAMAMAAIASAVTVVLTIDLPFRLGLIVAAVAGIAAGMLTERWTR